MQSQGPPELHHKLDLIMSAIKDFSDRVSAFQKQQATAVDGLVSDVKALSDKITALQNSQGQITPEDQALLDEIETGAKGIAEKLTALDDQTPPTA